MSPEERKRLDREEAARHFWSIANLAGLISRITSAISRELVQPLDPFKPKEIEGRVTDRDSGGVPDASLRDDAEDTSSPEDRGP